MFFRLLSLRDDPRIARILSNLRLKQDCLNCKRGNFISTTLRILRYRCRFDVRYRVSLYSVSLLLLLLYDYGDDCFFLGSRCLKRGVLTFTTTYSIYTDQYSDEHRSHHQGHHLYPNHSDLLHLKRVGHYDYHVSLPPHDDLRSHDDLPGHGHPSSRDRSNGLN